VSEPIFLGVVEYPDDGIRYIDGQFYYYAEFDVNGVHKALLDPASNYGKPAGVDLSVGVAPTEEKQ
jgi:hypothetical protein